MLAPDAQYTCGLEGVLDFYRVVFLAAVTWFLEKMQKTWKDSNKQMRQNFENQMKTTG